MTQISRDDVLHLAQLSSLQLADDEIEAMVNDIASIVGYINQLAELNTEGVQPTYQVTGLSNVWRNDEVVEQTVHRDQLVGLAQEQQAGAVKVPKVL